MLLFGFVVFPSTSLLEQWVRWYFNEEGDFLMAHTRFSNFPYFLSRHHPSSFNPAWVENFKVSVFISFCLWLGNWCRGTEVTKFEANSLSANLLLIWIWFWCQNEAIFYLRKRKLMQLENIDCNFYSTYAGVVFPSQVFIPLENVTMQSRKLCDDNWLLWKASKQFKKF